MNLVVAVKALLPEEPHKYTIQIYTDNLPSANILGNGGGRSRLLAACARELWLVASLRSTTIQIFHKPGKDLLLADALSRYNTGEPFRSTADRMVEALCLTKVNVNHDMSILSPGF